MNECYKACPDECKKTRYDMKTTSIHVGSSKLYNNIKEYSPSFKNHTIQEIQSYVK